MSFKSKNKTATVNELVDTEGFEYHKLKEFAGRTLRPIGFIVHNKSKYGKSACLVFEDCFVNMPAYVCQTFDDFTEEEIEDIKRGKMVITNIKEGHTDNGDTVFFDYDDYTEEAYGDLPCKAL